MRLTLFIFLVAGIQAFGQERDLSSYLPNAVDLGGDNFGIITGEVDENTLSFITVGDSHDYFFSGVSVKFYNMDFEATAYLVKTFAFGSYTLALYQCGKPEKLPWRSDHFDDFSSNSNSYRTFLDNGKSDNQWSNYREPIFPVNLSHGIATLRMGNQPLYSRGMPIFNDQGSIVGMIASKLSDEEHVTFEAIDFSIIEGFLYDFGKCEYFELIPFGQKITRCAKEEIEELLRKSEEEKFIRQNKRYKFAAAPALSTANVYVPARNEYQRYTDIAGGYTAGVNLHFWPDEPTRLNLKPRIGFYNFLSVGRIHYTYGLDQFIGMELFSFEAPIMWERVIKYYKKQNLVFALGYVPIIKLRTNAIFKDSRSLKYVRHRVGDSAFKNRLMTELTLERRKAKWSLFYSAQLNRWVDPEFEFADEFYVIRPFEGPRMVSHNIGLEFSWRLRGNWLLKEK